MRAVSINDSTVGLYQQTFQSSSDGRTAVQLLGGMKANFVMRGFFKWGITNLGEYTSLRDSVSSLTQANPGLIYEGGMMAAQISKGEFWANGTTISPSAFKSMLALDATGSPILFDNCSTCGYLTDLASQNYRNYLVGWSEKQIDSGVGALFYDQVYKYAIYKVQKMGQNPTTVYTAYAQYFTRVTDTLRSYAQSKYGTNLLIAVNDGFVRNFILWPQPAVTYQMQDLMVFSFDLTDFSSPFKLDENWAQVKSEVNSIFGRSMPIFAYMDWGNGTNPLSEFASLSTNNQITLLTEMAGAANAAGILFAYPVFIAGRYDSTKAGTYQTIVNLATSTARVSITIISSPAGSGYVTVDGVAITTPQTYTWNVGDTHTIAANTPVSCGTGCQYEWSSWSDGGPQSHSITVPSSPTTYTATFTKEWGIGFSYTIRGTPLGAPTAPSLSYTRNGVAETPVPLTGTSIAYWVDDGTTWTVSPNPLSPSTSTERWSTNQATSATASAPTTINLSYYHQFLQTLSYSVTGGSGYFAPTFTDNQFGSSFGQLLTTTPTGYWFDAGASWTVTNPLGGSSGSEQWVTSTASGGPLNSASTIALSYQHQYYLTMNAGTGGSVTPASGWQNAGAIVTITATTNGGYFTSWTGTGSGSFTGTTNPATVTMNGAITESAHFSLPITTMTVSYSVVGGGSPTAPVFDYFLNGVPESLTLTKTTQAVSVDAGSTWSVTPATGVLVGSSLSQRWYSAQSLTGTTSPTILQFNFQHQYYLTMKTSGLGLVTPSSGWHNAGQTVTVRATPYPGHKFKSWTGTGKGSYTGTGASHTITMNSAITETATFS